MTSLVWIVCTVAMAVLLVVAIVVLFVDIGRHGLRRACTRATVISLIACWMGILPFSLATSLTIPEGIIRNCYDLVDLISLSVNVFDIEQVAIEQLGEGSIVASAHALIMSILIVFVPLVVLSSVISALREIAQRYKIMLLGWRRTEAYVFSGAARAEAALATSILESAPGRPFILFCNVLPGEKMDQAVEEIRNSNRGNVVFTAGTLANTVVRLGRFNDVHCFFLSSNPVDNVSQAVSLTEWARVVVGGSGVLNRPEGKIGSRRREKLASAAWHVYCLHENAADELLFDSLYSQNSDPRVEVMLASEPEKLIWDLFTRHPLYEVLDQSEAGNHQHLHVLVVGLGPIGIEALRSAFWFGRMGKAVSLHVTGVGHAADKVAAMLQAECPEMMGEVDSVTGQSVVKLVKADVLTGGLASIVESFPSDWRTYCIVALDDDSRNLACAVELRRAYLNRMIQSLNSSFAKPVIAPLVRSSETFKAALRMESESGEVLELTPFGKLETIYSYNNIVDSIWEHRALAMNAAYDECWVDQESAERIAQAGLRGSQRRMARAPIEHEYAEYEIKKLSNRACVRHIQYKLWLLGLDSSFAQGDFLADQLTNEQWLEALALTPQQADSLFEDTACPDVVAPDADAIRQSLAHVRESNPVVSELSDIEHDRWCAYYRSHGWRDLPLDETASLQEMGVIKKGKHQSSLLKRHSYLCDSEELVVRGAQLGEDPFRYDRAAVVELRRILTCDVLESPKH